MQAGLPFMLNSLSQLAGILYVNIHPSEASDPQTLDITQVRLIDTPTLKAAEVRIALGSDILKIGLQAEHYFRRIKQIWSEFLLLAAVLAALGLFFAWLLHRYQSAYLNQVRHFERRIARHREDAVLGRAAAAITHEIRNPLNAIGMGLQRLQMEAGHLEADHQRLIGSMLQAVHRTDNIVSNIRRYAKPFTLKKITLRLDKLVSEVLCLYEQQRKAHQIKLNFNVNCDTEITGDRELLAEVVENLVKNGIEAQPDGGYLNINIDKQDTGICLSMENGGFPLSTQEAQRIMEPYFTTKAKGTGLGLAIAQRIMTAHGGRINVEVVEEAGRISAFL
jgi:signal transduction histidine kinase